MVDKNCEKVMESKRLFVGGLYNGVLAEDLRMKFKPFGNVKDLEIISRKDESGVSLKTFAYINIDISEKDFKKCLTTYNNCNWKGNVLKVQVAKEDFLSRLQKEKTATTESEKSCHILDKSVVMDIKSAVPGTPVPEKRNWVIGKFGRAMPIVFLRRKDGKKVAKFDPSKTSHCLKRIRVGGNQSKSVDNLTWKLGSCYPASNRSLDDYNLNKDCEIQKKHNSKKRSICEVEDGNEDRTSGKSRTKKKDTKTDILCHNFRDSNGYGIAGNDNNNSCSEVNERGKHSDSKVDVDCLAKRDIDLVDEDQGSTESDNSSLKCNADSSPQDVKTEMKSLYNRGDDANKLTQDKMLVSNDDKSLDSHDCSSHVSSQSLNDDDSSSTDAVELENSKTYSVNRKSEILDNDMFSTDGQSDSSSDEDSLQNDHDISDAEDQALTIENLKTNPKTTSRTRLAINSPSKLSKVKDPKKKKEESNKLRLESLKVRTQVIQNQKDAVRNALQKIDANYVTGSNHLTLEEDDGVLKSPPGEKKITGSKALSWLGMDSSSDDERDKNDEIFGWKEQFDGKAGEKLMKLQQKFGHDQRFKMDERFLDNDQEVDSISRADSDEQTKSNLSVVSNEGDEVDQQLKEEKQMSLKVLQDLLGSNSVFVRENDDYRNQYRDSLITHYDPSREDHSRFEEAVVKSVSPHLKESIVPKNLSETKEPEVTKDKFYSVSHSLQNFFGKKNEESSIFSFFPDLDENDQASKSDNTAEPDKTTQWKAPLKVLETLPYDSSATESEDENEEQIILSEVDSAPKTDHKRHLFYHPENKVMMTSLEEESSSFMRKESIENLKKYWVKVRQNLTLDYKKRRKDALRRQKKIAYKKPGSG